MSWLAKVVEEAVSQHVELELLKRIRESASIRIWPTSQPGAIAIEILLGREADDWNVISFDMPELIAAVPEGLEENRGEIAAGLRALADAIEAA